MNMDKAASILLVDDNDDARVTVARILEMAGHSVVQAPNAKVASGLLKELAPDLVIVNGWNRLLPRPILDLPRPASPAEESHPTSGIGVP